MQLPPRRDKGEEGHLRRQRLRAAKEELERE